MTWAIKGESVILYESVFAGRNALGEPIREIRPVTVENVLISPASSEDITANTDLYGKKAVYTLHIPKGDSHRWKDSRVEFYGKSFRTFGFPLKLIEGLVPLDWNEKVMVELYE